MESSGFLLVQNRNEGPDPRKGGLLVMRVFVVFVFLAFAASPSPAQSEAKASPEASKGNTQESEKPSVQGIPVTDDLVVTRCSSCHKHDEQGNLSRISWERTTPEGWQQAIKRMVRLHNVSLTPDEARRIVRYLSNEHGLAPEEAKPALYIAERRAVDETIPDASVGRTCAICHPYGRAMSWRRSKEDWQLLVNMHLGFFPPVDMMGFYPLPAPLNAPPPPPGADTRDPIDKAVDFLAKNLPLHTPEWSAWSASKRNPKLAGRWLISGRQPGRGRIVGEMNVEATGQPDEFTTRLKYRYLKGGNTVERQGRAIVYTGYAWRGRSTRPNDGAQEPEQMREVMMVSRDQTRIEGRWFWGDYDEFGFDVALLRAGGGPVLLGANPQALQAGTAGAVVRIYGDRLPTSSDLSNVDLGKGISVRRIVDQSQDVLTLEVDVAEDAVTGMRDVAVGHALLPNGLAVFDAIDFLKVVPESGLAHLGGIVYPKGYQQFEAVAYHCGPDGEADTPDDVELGVMDVQWSVEEFFAVFGDDDMDFVGALDANGLFKPAVEGPNPKRKFSRNNYGDVWVVATLGPDKAARDGGSVTGRAHLIVTVPLYVRWDQPEVAQ